MLYKLATLVALLAPNVGVSTPSPAIKVRDVLMAANENSFTVMRYETEYPGSYFAYTHRVSLMQFSTWSNVVQDRCVMIESHWATDAAKDDGVWFVEGKSTKTCAPDPTQVAAQWTPGAKFSPNIVGSLLSAEYISQRVANATGMEGASADCQFLPNGQQVDGVSWIFFPISCGAPDTDTDHAEVFVPVSSKTWSKAMSRLNESAKE